LLESQALLESDSFAPYRGRVEREVGARIRRIREAAGLRAQDLAARVELDPTAISKIENGKRAIKTVELSRIAGALKVSPLALLEDDPLLSNLPVAARQAGTSIATGGAYQRLVNLAELHTVLADAGIPTSPNLASVPPVANVSWFDGAKRLAEWARDELSLTAEADQRLGALADLIEYRLKIDVVIERYEGDPLSGAAITDPSFPLIFVNSDFWYSRSLFTLAHELGHVLARHSGSPITLDRELSGSNESERMANAFAANYLMPEPTLRDEIARHGRNVSTLIKLTYDLGVSFESLVYQLHNIGVVNAEGRDFLRSLNWPQLTSRLGRPDLGGRLTKDQVGRLQYRGSLRPASRPPSLLLRRAYEAYQKGIISIRPLAGLKGVDPENLLEQLEADVDIESTIVQANAADFAMPDQAESVDEKFSGNPV